MRIERRSSSRSVYRLWQTILELDELEHPVTYSSLMARLKIHNSLKAVTAMLNTVQEDGLISCDLSEGEQYIGLPVGKAQMTHDWYCWTCHKSGEVMGCDTCWRSFHEQCLSVIRTSNHFICDQCKELEKQSTTKLRSLSTLVQLLVAKIRDQTECLYNLKSMGRIDGNLLALIHFKQMDLDTMLDKARRGGYQSTEEVLADCRTILHNVSLVCNCVDERSRCAEFIIKSCQTEIKWMFNCEDCYYFSNAQPLEWFIQPCRPPHTLVLARFAQYPYWPAKVLGRSASKDKKIYHVRFFGEPHERANVSTSRIKAIKSCISPPQKVNDEDFEELSAAYTELKSHMEILAIQQNLDVALNRYNSPAPKHSRLSLGCGDAGYDRSRDDCLLSGHSARVRSRPGSKRGALSVRRSANDDDEDDDDVTVEKRARRESGSGSTRRERGSGSTRRKSGSESVTRSRSSMSLRSSVSVQSLSVGGSGGNVEGESEEGKGSAGEERKLQDNSETEGESGGGAWSSVPTFRQLVLQEKRVQRMKGSMGYERLHSMGLTSLSSRSPFRQRSLSCSVAEKSSSLDHHDFGGGNMTAGRDEDECSYVEVSPTQDPADSSAGEVLDSSTGLECNNSATQSRNTQDTVSKTASQQLKGSDKRGRRTKKVMETGGNHGNKGASAGGNHSNKDDTEVSRDIDMVSFTNEMARSGGIKAVSIANHNAGKGAVSRGNSVVNGGHVNRKTVAMAGHGNSNTVAGGDHSNCKTVARGDSGSSMTVARAGSCSSVAKNGNNSIVRTGNGNSVAKAVDDNGRGFPRAGNGGMVASNLMHRSCCIGIIRMTNNILQRHSLVPLPDLQCRHLVDKGIVGPALEVLEKQIDRVVTSVIQKERNRSSSPMRTANGGKELQLSKRSVTASASRVSSKANGNGRPSAAAAMVINGSRAPSTAVTIMTNGCKEPSAAAAKATNGRRAPSTAVTIMTNGSKGPSAAAAMVTNGKRAPSTAVAVLTNGSLGPSGAGGRTMNENRNQQVVKLSPGPVKKNKPVALVAGSSREQLGGGHAAVSLAGEGAQRPASGQCMAAVVQVKTAKGKSASRQSGGSAGAVVSVPSGSGVPQQSRKSAAVKSNSRERQSGGKQSAVAARSKPSTTAMKSANKRAAAASVTVSSEEPRCTHCNKKAEYMCCTSTNYCSHDCQRLDWPRHRLLHNTSP